MAVGDEVFQRDPSLAVRLHDLSAALAVGVALMKDQEPLPVAHGSPHAIGVFESVLTDLKHLAHETAGIEIGERAGASDLDTGLREEAARVGVILDLDLRGDPKGLAADQRQLVLLAGREAIRNVKRHAGAARCSMTVDVADCPFVLRVRDWGAGISPEASAGNGLTRLRALATNMGCELTIGSQPGLGTELVLVGRRCPRSHNQGQREAQPRSVVAKESLSSRKRVAGGRPIRPSSQQIT